MKKKKETRGGARKGAGRKPGGDPKIGITIYIPESIVKEKGKRNIRDDAERYILEGQAAAC